MTALQEVSPLKFSVDTCLFQLTETTVINRAGNGMEPKRFVFGIKA
jgi:hypothetical protein